MVRGPVSVALFPGCLKPGGQEGQGLFLVNLDTAPWGFDDEDVVVVVDGDCYGAPEVPLPFQVGRPVPLIPHLRIGVQLVPAPLGYGGVAGLDGSHVAGGVEYLEPVVLPVGHVDHALFVHRHVGGPIQLAVSRAGYAELLDKLAVGREFLNAVISPVCDVDVALRVEGDSQGMFNSPCPAPPVPHLEIN